MPAALAARFKRETPAGPPRSGEALPRGAVPARARVLSPTHQQNNNASIDDLVTNHQENATMFVALEVSYLVIKTIRPLVAIVERSHRDLADQILRAATSVSLNLAEGQRSAKGNRAKHAIAHGSANEVKAGIQLAIALGVIDDAASVAAMRVLDRQLALLWRLTHPSPESRRADAACELWRA
jgi:four helix bundle protein